MENKSTEINELFTALSLAQSDMRVASKDSQNPFFKSQYANLQSVIESSREALCKNGLAVTQIIQQDINGIDFLVTMLCHKSGQYISSSMKINPSKPDVQSLGSYITYLRRYCYSAIVGVYDGFSDDDGNDAMPEKESKATQEQLASIVKKIEADHTVYDKIVKRYHIKELVDLNINQAEDAIKFYK